MNVTRTTNANGTYRYEIDGELQYKASKVLYTHVSTYTNGAVLFHKTEAAARKTTGYKHWTKAGHQAIENGDAAPAAPVEAPAAPAATPAELVTDWETFEGETYGYNAAGVRVIEISARVRASAWATATNVRGWAAMDGNGNVVATGEADGLRASRKAALAALAAHHAAAAALSEPRPPRKGTRVVVNATYPSGTFRGARGKVESSARGDDGRMYVTVDLGTQSWVFLVTELDVI